MEGVTLMKNKNTFSKEHLFYIKKIKRETRLVYFSRFLLLLLLVGLWEVLARLNIIDSFISSSPSRIVKTIKELFIENDLMRHIGVTMYETSLGFFIAVGVGYLVALLLWWSERTRRILEPYIVVLNSLPKIALGPIIIVWFGSGSKAIIFMAVLIGIIVAIMTMLNGFLSTDKNKILLLKSMGANKMQVLVKLVIPGS